MGQKQKSGAAQNRRFRSDTFQHPTGICGCSSAVSFFVSCRGAVYLYCGAVKILNVVTQ